MMLDVVTTFRFSTMRGNQSIMPAVTLPFAFPGPPDYPNGIIGDLGKLPCFRGGIALRSMLEEKFGIPTFINNDGDLYRNQAARTE